ncbi:isochorismatase family cysteine hydrolase [Terrarubrum flagellatum]|uniref:isochorismatase family cysteine hydrolase n=1 Tax=Terrirubrum flagellatum TaxID=2895980 RepID=UPI003144E93A
MTQSPRPQDVRLRRETPIEPTASALLIVDVQNLEIAKPVRRDHPAFVADLEARVVPNIAKLIAACRQARIEVVYTVVESLTRDGRDRSLDYKLSGIFVPKGAWEGKVIDAIAPDDDDIVLPKTSSGVFNSTNIDYVLRNLGVQHLMIVGLLTDQCVDMAVRDAADRGYYPICVSDCCSTYTPERHSGALKAFGGYCRTIGLGDMLSEIATVSAVRG